MSLGTLVVRDTAFFFFLLLVSFSYYQDSIRYKAFQKSDTWKHVCIIGGLLLDPLKNQSVS